MTQAEKTQEIIAAFYEVYNALGYGFIENVYQNALYRELQKRGIPCIAHPKITVYYKDDHIVIFEVASHFYKGNFLSFFPPIIAHVEGGHLGPAHRPSRSAFAPAR